MIHSVGLRLIARSCNRLKKEDLRVFKSEQFTSDYNYWRIHWLFYALAKLLIVDALCVSLSRGAVHQHISVQLPDPGECGERGFFLWGAVAQFHCTACICIHSCAIEVVVKSEIVSDLHAAQMGKLQTLFFLFGLGIFVSIPLLYWVKVIYTVYIYINILQ